MVTSDDGSATQSTLLIAIITRYYTGSSLGSYPRWHGASS